MYIYKYIYKIEIHIPSCNHHPKQDTEHFHTPRIPSYLLPVNPAPASPPRGNLFLISNTMDLFCLLLYFIYVEMHNIQYGL